MSRLLPLLVAIIATCACIPFALRLDVAAGNDAWIDQHGAAWKALRAVEERFGRDDGFVIGVFAHDVLASEVLVWQGTLESRIAACAGVMAVRSLRDADDVQVDDLGPSAVPLIPTAGIDEQTRSHILHHPLYAGLLVNPDGHAAAILVQLAKDLDERGAQRLERELRALLAESPPPAGVETVLGGLPAQKQTINQVVLADQRVTVPVSIGIHACLMTMILRRLILVAIPLLSIATTMLWIYAVIALTGTPLDAVLGLLPPLVMGVAVASALHLVYAFAAARGAGTPRTLRVATRQVSVPLLLAVLTTIAGVLGLCWGPVEAVRRFAPYAAAGVALAALAPYLWLWALAPWISEATARSLGAGPFGERLGERLGRIAGACAERRVAVLICYAALIGAACFALTRLSADANFVQALPADNAVRSAHLRLDHELTGALACDLLIDLQRKPQAADLEGLRAVEDAMRADPAFAYCVSLVDLIGYIEARAAEAGRKTERGELLGDLSLGAPKAWRQFVGAGLADGEDTTLRILARQRDASVSANAASAAAAAAAARRAFPGATVLAASGGLLLDETSQRMLPAVERSVLLPLPCIALLLLLFLRSARLAALAIPIAGAPLLFTYALLPAIGWPVDIGVSMIACIALGIIVDDSVRMLYAIGRHHRAGEDGHRASVSVGPVLFGACLAMAGSFLACMAGQFAYTRHFGILLAVAFIIGLAVNLTLAPALAAMCIKPLKGAHQT